MLRAFNRYPPEAACRPDATIDGFPTSAKSDFTSEAGCSQTQRPHDFPTGRRRGQRQRRKLRDSRLSCTRRFCEINGRFAEDCTDSGSQCGEGVGGDSRSDRHDVDSTLRREADASGGESVADLHQLSSGRCVGHWVQQWQHRTDGSRIEDVGVRRTDLPGFRQDSTVVASYGSSGPAVSDLDVESKAGWLATLFETGCPDMAQCKPSICQGLGHPGVESFSCWQRGKDSDGRRHRSRGHAKTKAATKDPKETRRGKRTKRAGQQQHRGHVGRSFPDAVDRICSMAVIAAWMHRLDLPANQRINLFMITRLVFSPNILFPPSIILMRCFAQLN